MPNVFDDFNIAVKDKPGGGVFSDLRLDRPEEKIDGGVFSDFKLEPETEKIRKPQPLYQPEELVGLIPPAPRIEDPQTVDIDVLSGQVPKPIPPIGFGESIAEEFTRPAKGTQQIPIVGGAFGAAENLLYLNASKRLQSEFDYSKPIEPGRISPGAAGYTPPSYATKDKDEKLISDMILRLQNQQERGYSFGGKVAKGLLQLPTWMIEFALTGGIARIGSKVVQEAGEKLLKSYAKTKAGQLALKTAGWTGGAITRASLGLAPRIAEKATQRQVGVQVLGTDQEGWATSFAKAWGDVTIEAASETAGEAITGIPLKILGKTKMGGKFVNGLRKTWMKATGGTAGDFAKKMAKAGGYSNIIGEMGEERLGTFLRAMTNVDDFGAGKDAGPIERLKAGLVEDAKNLGVEAVVLSVPMAGQVVLGQAGRIAGDRRGDTISAGPETDIAERIPPISEAVDTAGLPPIETVPEQKPSQVPIEPAVTPDVEPRTAIKPVPEVGKEPIVKPPLVTPPSEVSVATIKTSIGNIEIPAEDLDVKWDKALEVIFDYGNQEAAGKPNQPDLPRSLSMGDTVEYEGKNWLLMPSGWQDVSQLSQSGIDKLVGEAKIPTPAKPVTPVEAKEVQVSGEEVQVTPAKPTITPTEGGVPTLSTLIQWAEDEVRLARGAVKRGETGALARLNDATETLNEHLDIQEKAKRRAEKFLQTPAKAAEVEGEVEWEVRVGTGRIFHVNAPTHKEAKVLAWKQVSGKGRDVIQYIKPTEAKPEVKGEIDVKAEEAITEPKPSIEEQQGKARPSVSLEPTGKLDPTNAEDAAKIIEEQRMFIQGEETAFAHSGIYESELNEKTRVYDITKIIYTHEQVDQAYRTLQTEIESPMDDTKLFAMPGWEKQLAAIGKKMAKMKALSQKKRQPSIGKARQLPRAKTKKQDFVKAIQKASSREESKYAISGLYVEGDNLIATDGRRLFVAKGKWGKDGIHKNPASLRQGLLGGVDKSGQKFPAWKDIFPDYEGKDAITIGPNAVNNDLPTVWRRLHQAASMTTEETRGIVVILNKDGSLGFAASAPEVGHTEINVNPGGKILGAVNPGFLMDALQFHAVRGDNTIDFYFPFPDRPILTVGPHGETKTIVMPVTVGEPSTELKKELGIAEEKPKPKAEKKPPAKGGKKPPFKADPTIEQTTKGKPGFAGVAGRPGGPTQKPWLDDAKVKSPDPGMEAFFQRTKMFGSQKASGLLGKIKAGFRERFKFAPHLPDLPEAAIARDIIRTMPEAHRAATEKAFEDYSKVLDGDGSTEVLKKTGLDLYAKKIFVEDFIVEAEAGRDVPGGFTFEQLQAEKSRIDDLMEKLPSVKRAHEARQALWRDVSNDLADRGVISEENAKNPHYVRHFVLEHMEGKQFTGTGRKKLKQPFRAYKLGRKGTIKDVSTDILEVDTHALAQIKSDNAVEDAANEIANRYADKKNEGKEGFVEWHYKRPNMYYRAQTFDGSKLAQMVEGAADEVDVTIPKAMLREALVLGRKRKGLIIPRWLADQLDDLPVNKRSGYVVDSFTKPFIKWWKRYILRVNPFRYNRRNLIGDSERLNAAGRTHAFARTGEALKILWNKEGEIYDRARDLGVIGTSLWHEMGTAHRQRIFNRFKKVKNMSMFKMATAPLRITIDTVSAVGQAEQDLTQAREDILRLAVFLDALDDVDNFAAGKPTRYGPNIRHWAGWNQDVEAIAKTDRFRAAAKVSRETMVDYGDFTPWENDVLRQGLVPFWSFMKKNAQFWPHAIKEAAKEGGAGKPLAIAGTKAGWNLGKWAVRAFGIYGLAYLWNHRDDEADKKDDALQPWLRTRPHLNVGDGTLWEQTAFSDFTEWFNVDDISGDLQRFESGYITFKELMKATALNTAKGPVNKIAQGLNPFLKAPVTALGFKTFPDVTKPRQFAQAWSKKAFKEAALEVIGTDVKRFIRTQSGDVTVKEAFAYYLYGSMYRDTSPEELEKQIRRSLKFASLKGKIAIPKKGREREHEILKARLKAAQGAN